MERKHTLYAINSVVIFLTFLFFCLALFVKGITQGLLLEAGIFLVSIKLIIASQQIQTEIREIHKNIDKINQKIDK